MSTGLISSYQLLISSPCTNTGSKMKGSHPRVAQQCPIVPGPRPTKDKCHDILQISWHYSHDIGFPSHKANFMTFCVKCHDINLMTLGRWHPIKSWLLVKMKENNHNTCMVYLLNCIDKHIHSIEMFLACLKINVKHPKNIDVETCWLRPAMSQCTK